MTEQQHYQKLYNSLLVDGDLIYAGLLLERAAQKWPEHPAVICEKKIITYNDLFARASRVTSALQKAGLAQDKRIMLLYENSINFYVAYHAIWQMGAIVIPVNTLLHAQELSIIMSNAQPDALVVSSHLHEKAIQALSRTSLASSCTVVTESELNTFQEQQDTPRLVLPKRAPGEVSVILYTSGTTGTPKGVMLSSHTILINVIQGSARFTIRRTDSLLGALPLFHSYTQNTCVWLTTLLGLTAIIMPKIDRHALIEALSHKPTVILGIPPLYGLFCLMRTLNFASIRYFMCGGDALPDKIRMHFELIYRRKICNGYGLTETAPFISVDLDDSLKQQDTVGTPFFGIDCQIRDDSGHLAPPETKGVLWVKGANVMLGYHNAPHLTEEVLVNGWFNTGDIALITSDGKLILSGREKDLIKSKGIKIYPQEIENILIAHPQVTAAAVIGRIEKNEEIPVAYIAAKPPFEHLEQELKELCAAHLAFYEIPRVFIIRDALPMTPTGKVDKKILKREEKT